MTVLTGCLIIFTRYPQPGKAKTRLISALGAEGAATLQRQMTEHTLAQVTALQAIVPVSVEIWYADGDAEHQQAQQLESWLGQQWVYRPQLGNNLGDRLINATQAAFESGMQHVVTIGTDCPDLNAARLQQAFQLLDQHDLVLGPAADGGYYLIGLKQFTPALFQNITWSSEVVLQQTVQIAESLGLSIAYLDALTDIDRPEDLAVWEAVQNQTQLQSKTSPAISVIIPVLNEASSIQANLQSLQALVQTSAQAIEIIVVDGGSRDQTVALAKAAGARVIETIQGRATQMNAGAKSATGKILLFLHADTRLPVGFQDLVESALALPQSIAGAFELKIAGSEPGLRWVERGVRWRSRLLQLPYGDQAIFLKAEIFWQVGGFAELPIMEDFELVRRLQNLGQIVIVPAAVVTSGRRWQRLGTFRTTLINQMVIIAYFLGVSPRRIAHWYRSGLSSPTTPLKQIGVEQVNSD
jgi:uncharacterized protein